MERSNLVMYVYRLPLVHNYVLIFVDETFMFKRGRVWPMWLSKFFPLLFKQQTRGHSLTFIGVILTKSLVFFVYSDMINIFIELHRPYPTSCLINDLEVALIIFYNPTLFIAVYAIQDKVPISIALDNILKPP